MEQLLEWILEKIIMPVVVIGILVCIIAIPFFIYISYKDHQSPTFQLYKNEWTCTETASKKVNVMVGKVMTTQYRDVCVNYSWTNKG